MRLRVASRVHGGVKYELISHAMHRAEMYRARRVSLQFLAQFENVVVDSSRRRIVLVAPYLIQQFVATNDPVSVLHKKLKGLEFLGGQNYHLPIAQNFHF